MPNHELTKDGLIVELTKVSKVYPPNIVALRDVSLSVRKGELLFLTGESGAGKTTLLKVICCIERPTKGLIDVANHDLNKIKTPEIQRLRRQIGVAYQDFKLLPRHTVFQNIAMPLEVSYLGAKEIKDRVHYLLDRLQLPGKAHIPADKLSRGEQQRVAMARAAANFPALLLADEPTGNLDQKNSGLVLELLAQLQQEGTTIIIATHDASLYEQTNHRVLELQHGQLTSKMPTPLRGEA